MTKQHQTPKAWAPPSPAEVFAAVAEERQIAAKIKELQARQKTLKSTITRGVNAGEELSNGVYVVKKIIQHRTTFDAKEFEKDHPKLYREYAGETEVEMLLIKEAKTAEAQNA